MQRRNVIIYHTGALGDFVLSWPLAMALGRLYAQSRIIYVTHSQKGALAERALRVESADVEGGWHRLFAEAAPLPDPALQLLNGAHSIIGFLRKSDETWTRSVRSTDARADLIPLEPRPANDYRGHVTDFWIEQLGPWPAVQASAIAMVRSIQERGVLSSQHRGQTILIHPGSGGDTKCWPAEKFLELIQMLRRERKPVQVILGEVELEKWPTERLRAFEEVADVMRPANLVELFNTLSNAAVAVMNDSGPAHLSSIIGTPTLALFGPSNPTIWRPLGPRVQLIHENPLDSITPQRVYDSLMNLLRG